MGAGASTTEGSDLISLKSPLLPADGTDEKAESFVVQGMHLKAAMSTRLGSMSMKIERYKNICTKSDDASDISSLEEAREEIIRLRKFVKDEAAQLEACKKILYCLVFFSFLYLLMFVNS